MNVLKRIHDKYEKYIREVGSGPICAVMVCNEGSLSVQTEFLPYRGAVLIIKTPIRHYNIRSTWGDKYIGDVIVRELTGDHTEEVLAEIVTLLKRYEEGLDIVYKAQLKSIASLKSMLEE